MRLLVISALAFLGLSSCQSTPASSGKVVHVVLLWLKEAGNASQRERLLAAGDSLRRIPGLESLQQGNCLPSSRPIVDSTYDVGFVMTFPSQAAMNSYLTHPDHVRAANEVLKPLAKKIQVYDFVVGKN